MTSLMPYRNAKGAELPTTTRVAISALGRKALVPAAVELREGHATSLELRDGLVEPLEAEPN